MRAWILTEKNGPLILKELPTPVPKKGEILIHIEACGVCRTDLHILDQDLSNPKIPLILGHQIAGRVLKNGPGSNRYEIGDRVGVPWLGETCKQCHYCIEKKENLCDLAKFTGYQLNGGFSTHCIANESYTFPLTSNFPAEQVVPLLCAGLIGYRAYKKVGHGTTIGFYGFGSSAHILIQLAAYEKKRVFLFTKPGSPLPSHPQAAWAGSSTETPPELLDGAIVFAPVGSLMVEALKHTKKGGTVISAGIHMSDIPNFPYSLLWGERTLTSVANLTRQDGEEFLEIAAKIPIKAEVHTFPLEKLNDAVAAQRSNQFAGSCVLKID